MSRVSLHNDFVELDKMQVKIQGVEHDLQRISSDYEYTQRVIQEDTQCVIQELGSTYMNKLLQLRKLCFFNWEALAKDAVGQNLIPDGIFFCHVRKFQGKLNLTP